MVEARPGGGESERVRILHVNDEEASRYAVGRALCAAGFQVIEATTGREGLELAAASPPDLVVLDVCLPDLDGYEVCRRLKFDPRLSAAPVLHLSAHFVTPDDKAQGLGCGADAYLVLPVEPIELVATVKALLRNRRAEEQLRQSQERYHAVFDNVRDYAIILFDAENQVEAWNSGAERITGFTAAEAVGQPGAIIFTPEDRAAGAVEQEVETARAKGRADDERWHVRKDGSRFWGRGVMTALRGPGAPGGRVRGFIKVVRDETARKRAEEELRAVNETLEQRVAERTAELMAYQRQLRSLVGQLGRTEHRERQRLASGLHENLVQMLAVCKMKVSAAQAAGQLGDAVRAASAARGLLDEAIAYARSLLAEMSPAALNSQDLAAAAAQVAAQMKKHGLQVSVEDDGRPKPLAEDVLGLLFQAMRELLMNVVKHAMTAQATLSLRRTPDRAVVTVADEGRGFNASLPPAAPSPEGGFGLFHLRERLDLLGGRLEIESAPGKGTVATVEAPLQPD